MLKITSNGEALVVEGTGNIFYPNNATLEIPYNSIILVVDDSDMATFRSASNNDVLFSGIISDITIDGEAVTRDTIVEAFSAISNVASGGSGGGSVDAYTKAQSDARYAKKSDLESVVSDLGDTDTKVDQIEGQIGEIETAIDNKQDTLISGANIKTINNQSLLGSGNITIEGGSGSSTGTTYEIPNTLFTVLYDKFNSNGTDRAMGYSYYKKDLTDLVSFSFADLKLGDILKDMTQSYVVLTFKGILGGKSIIGGIWQFQPNKAPRMIYIYEDTFQLYIQSMLPSTKITQDNDVDYTGGEVDLSDYYTKEETSNLLSVKADNSTVNILQAQVSTLNQNKQDELVSGTNIKTINGNSILGPGDITISGGEDVDLSDYYTKEQVDAMGEELTTQINSKLPIDSFNQWSEDVASKSYVNNMVSEVGTELDAMGETLTDEINSKLSIDAFDQWKENAATKDYVDNKIAEIPSVDLSDYATKEELEAKADSDNVYTKNEVDTLFNNYIKTYTEDEFEALTDEEKNDGIIFITNNN